MLKWSEHNHASLAWLTVVSWVSLLRILPLQTTCSTVSMGDRAASRCVCMCKYALCVSRCFYVYVCVWVCRYVSVFDCVCVVCVCVCVCVCVRVSGSNRTKGASRRKNNVKWLRERLVYDPCSDRPNGLFASVRSQMLSLSLSLSLSLCPSLSVPLSLSLSLSLSLCPSLCPPLPSTDKACMQPPIQVDHGTHK